MASDIFQSCSDYDKGCVLSAKRGRRSDCEQACELTIVIWAAALFFRQTLLTLKSNTRSNFVFSSKKKFLINVVVCIFWSSQSHTWNQNQTWDLSKSIHRRNFKPKIWHPLCHQSSTVLMRKKTQKMSVNGEIYTAGKNFTLPTAVTAVKKYHLWPELA